MWLVNFDRSPRDLDVVVKSPCKNMVDRLDELCRCSVARREMCPFKGATTYNSTT